MTYHELLERFKNDQLDKEQKKQVEADIEKHEAISDYLLEAADIPELEELSLTEPADDATLPKEAEQSEQFAKEIKAYITRAFAKAGIIVGACVLAIVLFVILALPKVMDWFYYNPAKVVDIDEYGIETNQISQDISIYSEMFLPGMYQDQVFCEPEGYGSYNIYLSGSYQSTFSFSSPDSNTGSSAGKVVRNKLTLYNPTTLFESITSPYYLYQKDVATLKGDTTVTEGRKIFNSMLAEELDDEHVYRVDITFNKVLSYNVVGHQRLDDVWYPLCWKNENGEFENVKEISIGFADHYGYSTKITESDDDYNDSNNFYRKTLAVSNMLQYINDNQTFSLFADAHELLADAGLPKDYYAQIAQNIEEHGLYVYGCSIFGAERNTVLRWANDTRVAAIEVHELEDGELYSIARYDNDYIGPDENSDEYLGYVR